MTVKELQHELGLLERLAATFQWQGMEALENYAMEQYEGCRDRTFEEKSTDAALYMANSMYARGQGDTWLFLARMRKCVPEQIAKVRRKLDALRKEE